MILRLKFKEILILENRKFCKDTLQSMGLQSLQTKGPRRLLGSSSRAIRGQRTSGIPNRL